MIRIQVGNEYMDGYIMINCNTKHPSLEQSIVTKNLKVVLDKLGDKPAMPVLKFYDIGRGQMTVDVQNRHIRVSEVNVARGWTNKVVHWTEIYKSSAVRQVEMSDAEIKGKARGDVEYRKNLIAELEAMDGDETRNGDVILRKASDK